MGNGILQSINENLQFLLVCAVVIAVIIGVSELFERTVLAKSMVRVRRAQYVTVCVMVGAFYLGPVGGVVVELVKTLLKLAIRGTSTAFVGELANFVVGCAFAVPAAIVYHMNKSKKTAKMSLAAGTLCMAVFGSAFNAIYLIPAFATLYGIPLDVIVGMGTAINPAITSVWTLALFSVAPLNLLKGVLISVPTMLLYKRISKILQNAAQGHRVPESRTEN